MRGGRWIEPTGAGLAETTGTSRESINALSSAESVQCSRQRSFQQTTNLIIGEIDGAVHAGMICGKPRGCEQFGVTRRYLVERGCCGKQRQLLDGKPRHALRIQPAESLGRERYRLAGA